MHIVPNNKLSNHYVKKKVEKTVWVDDQTVSGSFRQNMEAMREKTKTGMFYEDYLNPSVSYSNNLYPDFYSSYPSMPSNDFDGSMIGVEGMNRLCGNNNVFGGDIRGLEENNSGSGFAWKNEDGNSIINSMVDVKDANDEYAIEFMEYTDPLNPDTDGDGLVDGQEVNGWNVMIAYKSGEDMVTEERTYRTNPTVVQSSILDSDNDGLSDYVETGMCRLCDYHPDQIEDWENTYPDLYSSYSWFIFDRAKKAYDDKLCETGNVSVAWQEYNNTLHSQFNPFVRESIPPIITSVYVWSDVRWGWISGWSGIPYWGVEQCWTKISVTVQDVSGIKEVKIGVTDRDRWKTFSEDDAELLGNNKYKFSTCIDIDYLADYLVDYHVKFIVTDGGDNSISFEKKINGVFGGFLDFLGDIWNVIAGAVTAAVKAVVDAINSIVNWVIEKVTGMINAVLQPIVNAINSWVQEISNCFDKASSEYEKSGDINESTSDKIKNLFTGGSLFDALVILGTVLYAALLIATPFTISFTFLLGTLIELLVPLILNAVAGMLSGDYPSLISAALTGDAGGFISALSTVVDISGKIAAVASLILSVIAVVKLVPMVTTVVGLILSVMGAIIAWFGFTTLDMVVGAGVAAFGLYLMYKGPSLGLTFDKIAKAVGWICLITSISSIVV